MSVVSEHERRVILDLLMKRISKDDFYRTYPITPGEGRHEAYRMLARALQEQDAAGVEFGLSLAGICGMTDEYLDVLLELATAPWHTWHEHVVDTLESLRSPKSIDTFVRVGTTHFPYRAWDECNSLGVKCAWALAKIGTPEAVAGLRTLAASSDPTLARTATGLLRRLAGEPPLDDSDDDDF